MLRNTKGFTLIELLIVVVIIGILAAIAIPKFASTKEKAYIAAMKSDLKNLVTAQEAYFSDQNPPDYAPDIGSLAVYFTPSTGVTPVVASSDPVGFGATATHASVPVITCAVFVGATHVTAPAVNEGEVTCG